MDDITRVTFVDLDPDTGRPAPTTFESMHALVSRRHQVSEAIPDNIRGLLYTAIDYFALAYEQANAGRGQLYERLTNDAFLKAVMALELALQDRLKPGPGVKLKTLIERGLSVGLLPNSEGSVLIWKELRDNRNMLAHGDADWSSYGPITSSWIGLVIDVVNAMYASTA